MFMFPLRNNCAVMHLLIVFTLWTIVTTLEAKFNDISGDINKNDKIPSWDPNGYIFFCLCMGRFGSKMDRFLGGLAFAKEINRTLVLPPFRVDPPKKKDKPKNIPFTEWLQKEPLEKYHRVVTAEDFMKYLAPDHWPVGSRKGFCYATSKNLPACSLKDGEPFTGFWDDQGIDFDEIVPLQLSYSPSEYSQWNVEYPASDYPVIAMRGAPASVTISEEHGSLQKYLVFDEHIEEEAQNYIDKHFKDEIFVGIHMRNAQDWIDACSYLVENHLFVSSPTFRCKDGHITKTQCLPTLEEIVMKTKEAIQEVGARVVFVATDQNPMIRELKSSLSDYKVKVYHMNSHLPLVDIAILNKSTWFVGNCVSAFTAYVKRHRDIMNNHNTSFFGM